nr:MAG TPA: hypothetical protein [Bacteriophage sp.]
MLTEFFCFITGLVNLSLYLLILEDCMIHIGWQN